MSRNQKRQELFNHLEIVCKEIADSKKIVKGFEHMESYWQMSYKNTVDDLSYSNGLINLTEQVLLKINKDLFEARVLLMMEERVKTNIIKKLKDEK